MMIKKIMNKQKEKIDRLLIEIEKIPNELVEKE